MKQFGRIFLLTTAFACAVSGQRVEAQVATIDPTVDVRNSDGTLPQITFDSNIQPTDGSVPPGSYTQDALNILEAERVAMQQVQAAILYLKAHRLDILHGSDSRYNKIFGDFYNPNSAFAGQYDRTTHVTRHDSHGRPLHDRFGHDIQDTRYNTAHFDEVLGVFLKIQQALRADTTYSYGAQTGNAASQAIFDAYRNNASTTTNSSGAVTAVANGTVGDPLFGYGTGNSSLHPAAPFQGPDLGLLQWGYSTSFTPAHLAQLASSPDSRLRWDEDNAIGGTLTPAQELAFFRDRLDAYASITQSTTVSGVTKAGSSNVYVGGAFLNELTRSDSTPPGTPNPYFIPTEFHQYQMIIAALAQAAGTTTIFRQDITTTVSEVDDFFVPGGGFGGGGGGQNGNGNGNGNNNPPIANSVTLPDVVTTVSKLVSVDPGADTSITTTAIEAIADPTQVQSVIGLRHLTTKVVTVNTSITNSVEPGLLNQYGDTAYFLAALDANSYAKFTDLFQAMSEGGTGNGTLLPPPGKSGAFVPTTTDPNAIDPTALDQFDPIFDPIVPGGFNTTKAVPNVPSKVATTTTGSGSGSGSGTGSGN
jgi:hypothetical protein